MNFVKRQWPVFVAFATGLTLWLCYYVPAKTAGAMVDNYAIWVQIIASFAAILGLVSVLNYHLQRIKLKRPGFAFSFVTLGAALLMGVAGFLPVPFPGFGAGHMDQGSIFSWLFNNTMVPMQATMFSILAFYIASAAFRAFRARSFEATALLIAACIVMIGRVPIGDLITKATPGFLVNAHQYHLLDFTAVSSWLLNVPNNAVQRGIMLGVILSQVAIGVRIIFGIERTYMGGGD